MGRDLPHDEEAARVGRPRLRVGEEVEVGQPLLVQAAAHSAHHTHRRRVARPAEVAVADEAGRARAAAAAAVRVRVARAAFLFWLASS